MSFDDAVRNFDNFFAAAKQQSQKRRAQESLAAKTELDFDAGSSGTDPPSPDRERSAAIQAIKEELGNPDMDSGFACSGGADDADDDDQLKEFWANAPAGSGMSSFDELAEHMSYEEANEDVKDEEDDVEDEDVNEDVDGDVASHDEYGDLLLDGHDDLDKDDFAENHESEQEAVDDIPEGDEDTAEDWADELDNACSNLATRLQSAARRAGASSSSGDASQGPSFQPRKWHWSQHKGPAKDLSAVERTHMKLEWFTRPDNCPTKGPAPADPNEPGFFRGQKWRAGSKRWGNGGGKQKRAGRDFAKEAREGKLLNKISQLKQARMVAQSRELAQLSPEEQAIRIRSRLPPPPPPPARPP